MSATAAIVIIGDEILSGKVQDSNSHFLATELRALGVEVRRVVVIPDETEVIARSVAECSGRYDYVFTSGGIGPTHDDVTMEGIARGFGLKTVINEKIMDFMRRRAGSGLNRAMQKMARLPEGAEVIEIDGSFPPVVLKNVFILPGVPRLLRRKFSFIKSRFKTEPFHLRRVFLDEDECFLAHYLETVVAEFPEVMVGSYPQSGERSCKVVVTLESRDTGALERAYLKLMALLPDDVVLGSEGGEATTT